VTKKLTTPLIGGNMKSLKPTIHAVVSTLLLVGTSLAFGQAIANPKFPAKLAPSSPSPYGGITDCWPS
jgi:hypothetical protein